MQLTVVFEDYRISAKYANGVSKMVDFYTKHTGDLFFGNNITKTAFTETVSNAGHNMDDYWAIQYSAGNIEIEYANGHPNQTISGNTGLSEYVSLMENWRDTIDAEIAEKERLAEMITWEYIRDERNDKITKSDKIIAWATETGNPVPSEWTTYRQDLRDITTTYGAPSGNAELVVFPDEPDWPTT